MNSAMVSLNRFWMSSMLPMFAICKSSRIFSRRAFSSGVRFLLGCIRKVGSYVQNGENDSGSSKEKKGLKRIGSLIIACRDTPEIFQATKTALYYIPALVSLPVIFPGMKQILGWWNCILGTLLSKEKSNFLCPIRPIAQNV